MQGATSKDFIVATRQHRPSLSWLADIFERGVSAVHRAHNMERDAALLIRSSLGTQPTAVIPTMIGPNIVNTIFAIA